MTALDIATTAAFLRYVHEPAIAAGVDGRVVISALQPPGSPSKYLSRSYSLDHLDDAADGASRISRSEMNGYCRVHLMQRDLLLARRGWLRGRRRLRHVERHLIMATKSPAYVVAATTFHGPDDRTVVEGTVKRSDDPIVKAHPGVFKAVEDIAD